MTTPDVFPAIVFSCATVFVPLKVTASFPNPEIVPAVFASKASFTSEYEPVIVDDVTPTATVVLALRSFRFDAATEASVTDIVSA